MSVYSARSDVAAVLSAALQLLVIARGHILCFICICILGSALRDNIKIHQRPFTAPSVQAVQDMETFLKDYGSVCFGFPTWF